MIIELSSDRAPFVTEADRLGNLSARATGSMGALRLEPICRAGDDDRHIWVAISALRTASAAAGSNAGFDAMIEYADAKGWLDETGGYVRAHIA